MAECLKGWAKPISCHRLRKRTESFDSHLQLGQVEKNSELFVAKPTTLDAPYYGLAGTGVFNASGLGANNPISRHESAPTRSNNPPSEVTSI